MNITSINTSIACNYSYNKQKKNKIIHTETDNKNKYSPSFNGDLTRLKGTFADIEKFVGQLKSFSTYCFPKNKVDSTIDMNKPQSENKDKNLLNAH